MPEVPVVDYSSDFPQAIIAQGSGTQFLALYKRDHPYRRADGKMALYELDYRWLSVDCTRDTDQAWACVQGSEVTFWQRKELDQLIRQLNSGKQVNVFDHFWLQ